MQRIKEVVRINADAASATSPVKSGGSKGGASAPQASINQKVENAQNDFPSSPLSDTCICRKTSLSIPRCTGVAHCGKSNKKDKREQLMPTVSLQVS